MKTIPSVSLAALVLFASTSAFAESAKVQMQFKLTVIESFKESGPDAWVSTFIKMKREGFLGAWENGKLLGRQSLDANTSAPSASGDETIFKIVGANLQRQGGSKASVVQVPVKLDAEEMKVSKHDVDELFQVSKAIELKCRLSRNGRVAEEKKSIKVKASDYRCARANSMMDCEATVEVNAICKSRL